MGKLYKKGAEVNPDNKSVKNYFAHGSGKAGGVLVGKRHSEGGIKAVNKSTGQPLEMEGGEVVITRNAVSDNTKREFNGEMLTNREILSKINESGGGVSFASGGSLPKRIRTSGKEYKYGGKMMKDHDIVSSCGCKHSMEGGGETMKNFKYSKVFSGITIYTNTQQEYLGNYYSPFESKGSFKANVSRGDLTNIAIDSKDLQDLNLKWDVDNWNTIAKKLKDKNIKELELITVGKIIKSYELKPIIKMAKGGLAKTPAPKKDRITGSKKNKPGSASSKASAKSITLSDQIVKVLKNKVEKYKKDHPSSKLNVNTLKAVMRRGMGAYSSSHRPTISGGAPNSRTAWGFARVNAFLKKKSGAKVKAAYVQDDDLMAKGGKTKGGDCFVKAGSFCLLHNSYDFIGEPYLVHAEVRGQGKIEGLRYGHAWVEDDKNVYDFSNGREIIMPKQVYYYYGDIKTDDPKKYQRYTFQEARDKMSKTKNYGSWDIETDYEDGGVMESFSNGGEFNKEKGLKKLAKEKKATITNAFDELKKSMLADQYKIVRTSEFKNWFGDWQKDPNNSSVIREKNGEPMVVWHGSPSKFNIFKNVENGVFYFAENAGYANHFADGTKNTYPYFLNIRKIFDASKFNIKENEANFFIKEFGINTKWLKSQDKLKKSIKFWELLRHDVDFRKYLINKGYDGVKYVEDNDDGWIEKSVAYGCFNANQIKLANGVNTTFSTKSKDIRYEDGGDMEPYKSGGRIKWHDSDAPDANGKFKELNIKELAAWLIKTRKKDVKKISASINQQIVFNRKKDPKYASKMEKVRTEVYKQLGREDLLANGGDLNQEITCVNCGWHWNTKDSDEYDKYICHKCGFDNSLFYSNDIMSEGGLLASNGKPSKLTPEQYRLVRTPEFKAWFGDWENDPENASKVVDENGEPMVVYHGTNNGRFNVFDNEKTLDKTFYFTDSKSYAIRYSHDNPNFGKLTVNSYVFEVFLNLKNPLMGYITNFKNYGNNDGSLLTDGRYVVLNSNQIKLADGTNKTFDMNNKDIRYEDGGELGQEITCVNCGWHWNTNNSDASDKYVCHKCGFDNRTYYDSDPIGKIEKQIALPDTYSTYDNLKPLLEKQGYEINKIAQSDLQDKSVFNKALIYKSIGPLRQANETINKIKSMERQNKMEGGGILFTINDDKIDDLLNRSNLNYQFMDDDGYLISEKDFEKFQEMISDKGYDYNNVMVTDYNYALGGKLKNSQNFFSEYQDWYKNGVSDKMTIMISIPNAFSKMSSGDNDVILDVFEKTDESVNGKEKLKELLQLADKNKIDIYLEPIPRYNKIKDEAKKKKITREYLISYYKKFDFELLPNGFMVRKHKNIKMEKANYMKAGGNLNYEITCEVLDENGERQIDPQSIANLTKCINNLPQTKILHYDDEKNDYYPYRKRLHKDIIYEFKKDLVCIERDEPIAILMGGSPASGKSTFLKKYAPYLLKEEILKIDADEIRARLPEYKGYNASQTHLETKDIVNTLLSNRNIGIPCRFDLIYDGTMNNTKSYLPLIRLLKNDGYKVFIVYIDKVPKDVIVKRALERYKKSGRFVPLEVIDDFFEKGTAAFEQLKKESDGFILVDGSNQDYKIIEKGGEKIPQDRNYSNIGEPIKITTDEVIKELKTGGKLKNSPDFLKGKKEELEEHRDTFEKLRKNKLTADQAAELVVLEYLKKKPDYYKKYSTGGKIQIQDKKIVSYKEFLDLDQRVQSPYDNENNYYYPLYCSKNKMIMFFKDGNRRNSFITSQLAYKSFLFHRYKLDFKNLSAKEKNALMLGKQSLLEKN
jgi:predicted ABC-type ATPase